MPAVARLANERDLDALVRLSEVADPRVYTLPRTGDELRRAIEHSQDSVARAVDVPADEQYLLVLEDAAGALAGVAAIRATAGSQGTFFAFRNDVIHHASRDLKISNNVHVLTLSSDLTGHSQLLSFFVDPRRTPRADGVLLSRARLALAGIDKHRFSQNFFASLAGWCDEGLASPFWDALGRKFFGMEFIDAERAVAGARNRALIVELMPHYPVYVPLLPPAARAAIGQLHDHSQLPYDILCGEGFEGETYVDIFDGGPILEAHASKLRTLSSGRMLVAQTLAGELAAPAATALVARAGTLAEFRCTHSAAWVHLEDGVVLLPAETMAALRAADGDRVFVAH
ncbi:MAG TPA: arginine N-succinyltransferase [Burkholderiaceae bacterium]